ncbi:uncharacterized protein LOC142024964 [Carettochelys insculpta]|uniref:uncharacterized protein LOC142024964 n=1 Tax=Carettochelys insculpta TaxID=44489 RepID=UPI003EBA68FC
MLGPRPKRAPDWSTQEVLALLELWGKDSVQAQLRSRLRNVDVYEKISQGMVEKGYHRDIQQCRSKAKELRQAYQKARASQGHPGVAPQTCRFYKELHAILGNSPPPAWSTPSESWVPTGCKEELPDEEEEENGRQAGGRAIVLESQERFVGPERDAEEGTSARSTAVFSSSPLAAGGLFQTRRGAKRPRNEAPDERTNAPGAGGAEPRVWRTPEKPDRSRAEGNERSTQQEVLGLLREQTAILRCLLDLAEKHFKSRLPLQPLQTAPDYLALPQAHSPWRRGSTQQPPFRSAPGEAARNHRRPYTDV